MSNDPRDHMTAEERHLWERADDGERLDWITREWSALLATHAADVAAPVAAADGAESAAWRDFMLEHLSPFAPTWLLLATAERKGEG